MKLHQKAYKTGAQIALVILTLYIAGNLVDTFRTSYQLASPIVPKSTIWEINKQFNFSALTAAGVELVALILYFFEKYVFVIILIGLILIINGFLYI